MSNETKPTIDANELQFVDVSQKGGTRIIAVMEADMKKRLGLISLYGPTAEYCFWPDEGARLNSSRLFQLADYTNKMTP